MEGYFSQQVKHPLFRDFFAGDSPAADVYSAGDISDSESGVTGSSSATSSSSASSSRRRGGVFRQGGELVEVGEGERIHEVIRRRFLSRLGEKTATATVVSIRRRDWSSGFAGQARLQAFQVHARAMALKNGGNPNVKFGWYGQEKGRIEGIISHGFSVREIQDNHDQHHTPAIVLAPDDSPASCLRDSVPDEGGLCHMLLCRVILGNPEVVPPGSGQTHPSSDEFDSGVDGLENPSKYIIWSTHMNTHILPEYVVTYRASSFPCESRAQNEMKMPTSPWISFPALISVLGRFLPLDAISLINKYHNEYKERRITRPELIQRVRQIAGDKLLIAVIKSCRGAKELKTSMGFLRNRNANK